MSICCANLEAEVTPFVFEFYIFGKQEKLSPSLGVDEDLAPLLARTLFEMTVGPPYEDNKVDISYNNTKNELWVSRLNIRKRNSIARDRGIWVESHPFSLYLLHPAFLTNHFRIPATSRYPTLPLTSCSLIERYAKITKYLHHVTLSPTGLSREWDGMNPWTWLSGVKHFSFLNIATCLLNSQGHAAYPYSNLLYSFRTMYKIRPFVDTEHSLWRVETRPENCRYRL